MKIAGAVVGMESSHQKISSDYSFLQLGVRMKKSDWEASQELLSGGKTAEDMSEREAKEQHKQKEEDKPAAVVNLSKDGVDAANGVTLQAPGKEEEPVPDKTMSTLRALLHYLKSISKDPKAFEKLEKFLDSQENLAKGVKGNQSNNSMLMSIGGCPKGASKEPTVLVDRRETFSAESEYTSFSAAGIAKTEEGRELSFNVDFEMSYAFIRKFDTGFFGRDVYDMTYAAHMDYLN